MWVERRRGDCHWARQRLAPTWEAALLKPEAQHYLGHQAIKKPAGRSESNDLHIYLIS